MDTRTEDPVAQAPVVAPTSSMASSSPASGPKRVLGDVAETPTPTAEPESVVAAQPPQKLPRLLPESAADAEQHVEPPQAPPGAADPSPLTQPLAQASRKKRVVNPAAKAAKMRLKRNVSKRALAPLAGGAAKAKKMLQGLEATAEKF